MYAFTADQMLEFYNIYLDEAGITIYSFVAELQRKYNISQNVSALIWQSFDASEVYLFQRIRSSVEQKGPMPTNVELIGYKNAKFNQPVTDHMESNDNTKWSAYRISLDMNKPLVVSLGRGREITIKLNSNRTNIGE